MDIRRAGGEPIVACQAPATRRIEVRHSCIANGECIVAPAVILSFGNLIAILVEAQWLLRNKNSTKVRRSI